jgi:hypothetical protein
MPTPKVNSWLGLQNVTVNTDPASPGSDQHCDEYEAQANNPSMQQPAPHNKHREFMSHHPLVFTHAADPLEAEDWLKTVLKMLTTC